jgi:hypothetical protein
MKKSYLFPVKKQNYGALPHEVPNLIKNKSESQESPALILSGKY